MSGFHETFSPHSTFCFPLGVCYAQARQALHTALPDRLLCREKEMGIVQKFIDNHVNKGVPGSMYISGAPGTGKTAVLSFTMKLIQVTECPLIVEVPTSWLTI